MSANKPGLLLFSLFVFILSGCRSDFEVNEPWKEIDIIYGLLDVNDTVQYIKINKAYLNEDEDVYKLASIEDTIYHQDSLDVRLLKNGSPNDYVVLRKSYHTDKDSGIFSNPGQYLYETPPGFVPDPAAIYTLEVRNTVTGVTARSKSPVVSDPALLSPSAAATQLSFKNDVSNKFPIEFRSGKGARFYDLTIVFHYQEYRKSDSVKIKDGSISWPIFTNVYSNPDNVSNVKQVITGRDFFRVVAQALEINAEVYRKVPPKAFEFKLSSGGEEIYNYMQVNRPTIGVVQKKPEYTNIENGFGIFSSRNRQILRLNASSTLIDELLKPEMEAYGFRR